MNSDILNRKGARKAEDIPNKVLDLLNIGEIETVNLTEWLTIDHKEIIKANFSDIGISKANIDEVLSIIKTQKKPSTMSTTKLIGSTLYKLYTNNPDDLNSVIDKLSTHRSDSIRCYAPYLISLNEKLSIEQKIKYSEKLIADTHFGVREIVWMALRPEMERNLEKSIEFLSTWTKNKDENIRRFTTESTRPRGVWCKHIDRLKENPEIALPILQELKSDNSKYAQDSVGNWLNDASKTKPNFVIELCEKWQKESSTKETEKIIKRAKRTINKNN